MTATMALANHPGETDGPCNGGPATGWWQERATTLATDAVR
jgi:hypothetical protein